MRGLSLRKIQVMVLGCLFGLPVGQMQILLNFSPFVPMLLGFLWLIVHLAKRMIGIADGFSDDFEGFDHGSGLG